MTFYTIIHKIPVLIVARLSKAISVVFSVFLKTKGAFGCFPTKPGASLGV